MLTGPFETRRALLGRVEAAGLDHVFMADHVSFFVGAGMDGLIQAATAAALAPRLDVVVGVYLLALRHPVPVARQIASLAEAAPGRLVLGVGLGGEDRHEIEICGVDPATRGRRTDECLVALRGLLGGEKFSLDGEFFQFEDAWILPAPDPPVPLVIGGRSDAAVRRAGRHGDGWLGVWCSATRFGEVIDQVDRHASSAGRKAPAWEHGLQVWVGVDADRDVARGRLARGMEGFYRTPYERFERYSPYGSAAEIADFLAPYAAAGCRFFNIMPIAPSPEAGIDAVAEIRERLNR
ncbi:MAG: LLM class flavin-dependent oxidoreductase [Deltaproteobacteria bacterium]|jgi:alkanesulfonate monooxygenase SsuD/methylene tetrahydromethanopterin reductase-like flavin-dependent oxidoreductase (luciferase family)|nr:LLM class flavin-dependent oxidoreductase [Deltaproteobacteria bacterium]